MLLTVLARAEPLVNPDVYQTQTNLLIALLNEPAPGRNWRELPPERLVPVPNSNEDSTPLALLKSWSDKSRIRDYSHGEKDTSKPPREEQREILAACEIYPGALTFVLEFLDNSPDIQDAVHEIYSKGTAAERFKTYERGVIEAWLMRRGKYLRTELIQRAEALQFNGEDIADDNELKWLADLDWPTAKIILGKHAAGDDPHVQTYALTLLFEHATGEERDRLRNELIAIAENKGAPESVRKDACKTVLQDSWAGNDEWFIHLLMTTTQLSSPLARHLANHPDHLIPLVTPYIDHENRVAHANAVRSLSYLNYKDPREESLRPLLPWLMNPYWAERYRGRLALVRGLEKVRIPKSVTGLIRMLNNDDDDEFASAADALVFQGATNAIPSLRKALGRKIDTSAKEHVIAAIYELGGFSLYEIATSVEIYAANRPADRETAAFAIGSFMATPWRKLFSHDHPITPALLFCADQLDATQPDTANAMRDIVSGWSEAVSDDLLLKAIQTPQPTVEQIKDALDQSHELRKRRQDVLDMISNGEGLSSAIATAVQGNVESAERILHGSDSDRQILLLACARLNRMELPIDLVEHLYDPEQKTLALAVDRYLRANDSQPARRARERLHPKEQIISGSLHGSFFHPEYPVKPSIDEETSEILELNSESPPDAVYLLSSKFSYPRSVAVVVRDNVGTFFHLPGDKRYASRELSSIEVTSFTQFIKRNRINELPPLQTEVSDGNTFEYAYLTPTNGCVVFMNNPLYELERAPIYRHLCWRFYEIPSENSLTLHYHDIDDIVDFEILHAGLEQAAAAVWSEDVDTRVLLEIDQEISRWHSMTGAVGAVVDQPSACNIIGARADIPQSLDYHPAPWKCATQHGLIRTGDIDDANGLWLCSTNSEPERLLEGPYTRAITSSNGNWIVAKKSYKRWDNAGSLILFNLEKRTEHPIPLQREKFNIIAYLDYLNAFLIRAWGDDLGDAEYLALDLETKETRKLDGVFWPLENLNYRPLQASAAEGHSWAAKYDKELDATVIGLYDTASCCFEPVMHVPGLNFDSMDLWVNEEQAKVYLVINGDLIRFALLNETNPL